MSIDSRFTNEEALLIFGNFDRNKDGVVDLTELYEWMDRNKINYLSKTVV